MPEMSAVAKLVENLGAIQRTCGLRTSAAYVSALLLSLPEIARSGSLLPADRRMAGRRWPFALQGVRFELDGSLFSGAREMYCRQVYFADADFAFGPGMTVVDLGANVGLFSLLAALAGCEVLAVEAQRGFVREIGRMAASHGVEKRIVVEHALVGAGSGLLSEPAARSRGSHAEGTSPPVRSLEELLDAHGIDRVDFLKVDVEGSEFDLFRSCGPWLGRVRRIAMELHPAFGSIPELVEQIRSGGMAVELRDNHLDAVDRVPDDGGYLFARRGGRA